MDKAPAQHRVQSLHRGGLIAPIEPPARVWVPAGDVDAAGGVKPIGTIVEPGEPLTERLPHAGLATLSPTRGRIAAITTVTRLDGHTAQAVEVETEIGSVISAPSEETASLPTIRSTDLGHWIEKLHRAGVTAKRHGSPDLHAQLRQVFNRPIDTVLCNLLDSDPLLRLNHRVAQTFPRELSAGIDLLAQVTGAGRVCAVADEATPAKWEASLSDVERADGLRIIHLRGGYPQADPTILLHSLLDRKLRFGRLPTDQGVLMFDAATAVAVGAVAIRDEPMLTVPVAMRDHVHRNAQFVMVPVGTRVVDLCAMLKVPTPEVIRGGDFLRNHFAAATSVITGEGELTIHLSGPEEWLNPDPCVRCGWCVEACPTRVQPAALLDAAQRDDVDLAEHAGMSACIECGICSYVCPSRLPLLATIRGMKQR